MAWHKTFVLVVMLLVSLTPRRSAAADDASTEDGIQQGVALRKDGKDEAALGLFLGLEKKNPQSVRVLLHVSAAAQATGRWIMAYDYLRKSAAYRSDPYYVRNRAIIKSAEEAVNQHVALLRVVGEPSGAEVRLSGNFLGTLPFEEPVPVELGSYTLEVTTPGFYQLRRDVTFNVGGALNQELVELKPRTTASGAPGPSLPPPTSSGSGRLTATPEADRRWWASPTVTWVLGGVAVAAAATSGVALVVRERNANRWNDDDKCLDRVNASRTREELCGSHRSTAATAGTVAVTAGAAAGVFAVATLVQLLATREEPAPRAEASASCGVGLGTLFCHGTF